MKKEIWKDLVGYEGIYKVSSMGRVLTLEKEILTGFGNCLFKEKILKPTLNENGYLIVNLTKDGKGKHVRVHRAVGMTFIPNPENKRTINHKNTIKTDNRVDNLEWATHGENHKHAYKNGLRVAFFLGKKGDLAINTKAVSQYTKDGVYIDTYMSAVVAEQKTRVCHKHIGCVCKGNRKSTGGFVWRYAKKEKPVNE